ncbi:MULTISPECIES: hypothetical protein [unclassified Pseudoalteromonas]|uniref:hypothetical protein n=1 Tax=unclassified Pseudoalteromonas TaxID=194690 RepID=UPI0005A9D8B4|nr:MULTISPECIES: hypothetical protein [unclassified Pseudoalteromonas]
MGRHKGDNPFEALQKSRIDEKVKIIKGYLASLPTGATFKDINALINHMAKLVGCATTTISRQPAYMNLLAAKFSEMHPNADNIDPKYATPAQVKRALDSYKVDIQTLQGKFKVKEKYYQSSEYINLWLEENAKSEQPQLIPYLLGDFEQQKYLPGSSASADQSKALPVSLDTSNSTANKASWQKKFEVTCEAFALFITHMRDEWGIQYDHERGILFEIKTDMGMEDEDEGCIDSIVPHPSAPMADLKYFRKFLEVKGRDLGLPKDKNKGN